MLGKTLMQLLPANLKTLTLVRTITEIIPIKTMREIALIKTIMVDLEKPPLLRRKMENIYLDREEIYEILCDCGLMTIYTKDYEPGITRMSFNPKNFEEKIKAASEDNDIDGVYYAIVTNNLNGSIATTDIPDESEKFKIN